ncbi:WAT1-related protein At2g39510-like [Pyrus communis]|uniref:WAT1-related protein At2g39510-like n=1 Tax=Pyrus communis TaxID=23211 RepID=UPI0035BFFD51
MEGFHNALRDCELKDMVFVGNNFTWVTMKDDGIKVQLDQALATQDWRSGVNNPKRIGCVLVIKIPDIFIKKPLVDNDGMHYMGWSMKQGIGMKKLLIAVILLQCGYAGQNVIARLALNQGMSHYVFLVYRMAIATVLISPFALILDRLITTKSRPKMTFSILAKTMLLSLFDPVLDMNLFYMAMSYSTATFTSAMFNILPAIAFFMAMIFRLEKVNIRELHSQAKVAGTVVTVGGAIILSLVKGPELNFPWTKGKDLNYDHHQLQSDSNPRDCCILFLLVLFHHFAKVVLPQAILSGVNYYIMGVVNKEKGPVYYSSFNPLGTVTTAIMGSLVLAEHMYLGSILGAIVIFVGLHLVLWGKKKDKPPSHSLKSQNQAPDDEEMTTNQQQMGI